MESKSEPKKILVSFLSVDQDDFNVKKKDEAFMSSFAVRPANRHQIWRPSVALAQLKDLADDYDDLVFDTYYLLYDCRKPQYVKLAETVADDIRSAAPETQLVVRNEKFDNPWDLEEVYTFVRKVFREITVKDPDAHIYVNVTTGTTTMRNCLFLLTQMRLINALRIAPTPWHDHVQRDTVRNGKQGYRTVRGSYTLENPREFADLETQFVRQTISAEQKSIKRGRNPIARNIYTVNKDYLSLLEEIHRVAVRTREPILLTGPTGCGKTQIADNICALKTNGGRAVVINCATLGGDPNIVLSTLFGSKKGSHSKADKDSVGAFHAARGGVLFLDEIGELHRDVQPVLLKAIEEGRFTPLGATEPEESDFLLICGTNRDLEQMVDEGAFRLDLLERINIWPFAVPTFAERLSTDLDKNCDDVLSNVYNPKYNAGVTFPEDAKRLFLDGLARLDREFASPDGTPYGWPGNFREFNAIIFRMANMADGAITTDIVNTELDRVSRLRAKGRNADRAVPPDDVDAVIRTLDLDTGLAPVERVELREIVRVCRTAESQADAARKLYGDGAKSTSSRLHHYLRKRGTSFADLRRV